eukprot:Phypoly_transcript_17057.p1 GENE.Phypoly_transcript_17057~~Phypoly_transcript_17057.p1  ORF type:complete len:262 (+),score=30.56 Phypoly_transcript_17057:80-787(+)
MKHNSAYRYVLYKLEDANNKIKVVVDSASSPSFVPASACHPPTTSAKWSASADTFSLGVEPLMIIMGHLDTPNLLELRTVCKTWCKFIDENEERLLHASLISGRHIKSSFEVSSVGFTSWRQFIMERLYEKKNYTQTWNALATKLPERECRFIVYKFHEPAKKPYFVFILWGPDSAPVRAKMIYSSTKMIFLRGLQRQGVQTEQQACDEQDLAKVAQDARAAFRFSSDADKVFSI